MPTSMEELAKAQAELAAQLEPKMQLFKGGAAATASAVDAAACVHKGTPTNTEVLHKAEKELSRAKLEAKVQLFEGGPPLPPLRPPSPASCQGHAQQHGGACKGEDGARGDARA